MASVESLQISAKYFDCCEVRSASLSLLPPFSLLQLVSPPPPSWQQLLDGFNLQPHKGLEPEEFNIFQQSRSRDLSAWRGIFTTIRPTSGQFIAGGHGGIFVVISLWDFISYFLLFNCQYCLYTTAPLAGSGAHRGRGGGGVKLLIKVLKVWEFMCREPGRWCHLSCSASFIHLNPGITHTLRCYESASTHIQDIHYIYTTSLPTSFTAPFNIHRNKTLHARAPVPV